MTRNESQCAKGVALTKRRLICKTGQGRSLETAGDRLRKKKGKAKEDYEKMGGPAGGPRHEGRVLGRRSAVAGGDTQKPWQRE